jgi:hypothetical protein
LRTSPQRDLNQYLNARSKIEHLSAISLSISFHDRPENINLTAGRAQYGGVTPVKPQNLTLDQSVGRWLPQYPAWKNVTIRASMGFRMMYVYYPRQDAVITFALNSMPGAEDKVPERRKASPGEQAHAGKYTMSCDGTK